MADQKKDDKTAQSAQDDKNINDLLKEYAEDVKDKDLDEFLKDSEDEAFEADVADEDADDEAAAPAAPAKASGKSGGMLTALMLVVAFGAAGAGAYMYMHRNDGMTSIMGGFSGAQPSSDVTMDTPVKPDEAPAMPAPVANVAPAPAQDAPVLTPATETAPDSSSLAQPLPQASAPALEPAGTPVLADVTSASAQPAQNQPASAMPVPVTAATPAPAAAENTDNAVQSWVSGAAPEAATPKADEKLPEQSVKEIKARPPVMTNDAPKKVTPVKTEKPVAALPADQAETAMNPMGGDDGLKAEDKAGKPAVKKAKVSSDPMDAPLPPPYLAIQASKGGAPVAAAAPAVSAPSAAPKMAPVVDDAGAKAAANVATDTSDVTRTTGDLATMVGAGGGKIEIVNKGVAPAAAPVPQAAMAPAPAPSAPSKAVSNLGTSISALAIGQGGSGRSLPDTDDNSDAIAAPVTAPAAAPAAPAAVPAPAAPAVPVAMPAPASVQDAKTVLAQAIAMEKAGNADQALSLYQRALELDAVYADGKSIDRGMVYDRIGAIRAAAGK